MRRISAERRKLAGQAGAVAAISGSLPLWVHHFGRWGWVGIAILLGLEARIMVLMVRVRRREECA